MESVTKICGGNILKKSVITNSVQVKSPFWVNCINIHIISRHW